MDINCNYTSDTGNIVCDLPYLQSVDGGSGQTFYYSTLWSGGEVLIAFFLFVLVIFLIGREFFRFFFPYIVKIKRKND